MRFRSSDVSANAVNRENENLHRCIEASLYTSPADLQYEVNILDIGGQQIGPLAELETAWVPPVERESWNLFI